MTTLYSESSSTASDAWSRTPPVTCLDESAGRTSKPATSTLTFGLEERISLASSVKPGATRISVNMLEISAARFPSTSPLRATIISERGLWVRSERLAVSIGDRSAERGAAGVGVLDDNGGLSFEVAQVGEKGAGGVEVVEVVEGDLSPLQLLHTTQQMLRTTSA